MVKLNGLCVVTGWLGLEFITGGIGGQQTNGIFLSTAQIDLFKKSRRASFFVVLNCERIDLRIEHWFSDLHSPMKFVGVVHTPGKRKNRKVCYIISNIF